MIYYTDQIDQTDAGDWKQNASGEIRIKTCFYLLFQIVIESIADKDQCMTESDQNFESTVAKQIECTICGQVNSVVSDHCHSCGHALGLSNTEGFAEAEADFPEDETIMVIKSRSGPRRYRMVMLANDAGDPQCFEIKDGSIVGRSHGDIQLRNGHISRRHCAFSIRNDRLYLSDLKSTNGVFLRVRDSVQIDPPAELLMGRTVFRVVRKS